MTDGRDFKNLVRQRAAETGESYQAAWQVVRLQQAIRVVDEWLASWWAMVERRGAEAPNRPLNEYERAWLVDHPLPLQDMQMAATGHPKARIRVSVLDFLDHHASDASTDVFRAALSDKVPRVRLAALHGLSCQRCRTDALAENEVVPAVSALATGDANTRVRHAAVLVLAAHSPRSAKARAALQVAATDSDGLVRQAAQAALDGRWTDVAHLRVMRRRLRGS